MGFLWLKPFQKKPQGKPIVGQTVHEKLISLVLPVVHVKEDSNPTS